MICFSRISIRSGVFGNLRRNWLVRDESETKPGKRLSTDKKN